MVYLLRDSVLWRFFEFGGLTEGLGPSWHRSYRIYSIERQGVTFIANNHVKAIILVALTS